MTRIALVFAVALSICASAAMAQDYSIGTIQVAKPWSRATPKGAKVAGAYMTITNKGTAPDRLVGGSTAGRQRIRGPQHGDGAGRRQDAAGGRRARDQAR